MRTLPGIVIIAALFLPMTTQTVQAQARNFDILLQASWKSATMTDDFEVIGSIYKSKSGYRIQEYYLAVNPIYRVSEHISVEFEIGHSFTKVTVVNTELSETVTDKTWMYIPHVTFSFGAVDSVLVPFLRSGVGWTDSRRADYPYIVSFGTGAAYLAGDRLFFRGELNYRFHHSHSGRITSTWYDWTALSLLFGVGFRL